MQYTLMHVMIPSSFDLIDRKCNLEIQGICMSMSVQLQLQC